jgi:HSP20 family molecular chaperone IbpA
MTQEPTSTPVTPDPAPSRGITLSAGTFSALAVVTALFGAGIAVVAMTVGGHVNAANTSQAERQADIKHMGPPRSSDPVATLRAADPFGTLLQSPADPNAWDPFQEMEAMQRQMNAIFNQSFSRFSQSPFFQSSGSVFQTMPRMDVQETTDEYIVMLDMPGLSESSVDVTLDNQTLKISGESTEETENSQGNVLHRERRSGQFQRSIPLDSPVDVDGMTTDYDNGVLTVHIPKTN